MWSGIRVAMPLAEAERLEMYCMRRTLKDPRNPLTPSTVARLSISKYLTEAEAEEALTAGRRPACVYADCVGGLRWCPEHDLRWQAGDEVPESCRGDG